jgi:hypothetical protein
VRDRGGPTEPPLEEEDMRGDRRGSSIKDPELFERLLEQGASAQKAARISNAAAKDGRSEVGRRGGRASDYGERTVPELRDRARDLGLTGYSRLRKDELIDLLRGDRR